MSNCPVETQSQERLRRIDEAASFVASQGTKYQICKDFEIETDDDSYCGDLWATVKVEVRVLLSSQNEYRLAQEVETALRHVGGELVENVRKAALKRAS